MSKLPKKGVMIEKNGTFIYIFNKTLCLVLDREDGDILMGNSRDILEESVTKHPDSYTITTAFDKKLEVLWGVLHEVLSKED